MIKSPLALNMLLLVCSFLLPIVVFSACNYYDSYSQPAAQNKPPPPQISASPSIPSPQKRQDNQPVWNAYYQLPSNWHVNLDDVNQAKLLDSQDNALGLITYLEISKLGPINQKSDLQKQAEALRDSLLPCLPTDFDDVGRNCQKPTQIFPLQLLGKSGPYDAVILRYYGTWQSRDQEVNEIFIDQHGQLIHFSLQGKFTDQEKVLSQVLDTLSWKLEAPLTGLPLEPEKKGL